MSQENPDPFDPEREVIQCVKYDVATGEIIQWGCHIQMTAILAHDDPTTAFIAGDGLPHLHIVEDGLILPKPVPGEG